MFKQFKIRAHQVGLLFRDDAFVKILTQGRHRFFSVRESIRCETVSTQSVIFEHDRLREIVNAGVLDDLAEIVDVRDEQRALVWVDGRFARILDAGLHVLWNEVHEIRIELVDIREVQFRHSQLGLISRSSDARRLLDVCDIAREHAGVLFIDGRFQEVLNSGRYAFWLGAAESRLAIVDLRECTIDVSGQELMTADKVSIRLNALATFQVVDPRKSVSSSENAELALYRAVQLALRQIVGTRTLDEFLADKEAVAAEALQETQNRGTELGLKIISVGVRDVVLPGDMKELMNKVTEARKAAEANLIFRREETAAMRSQANTAKLLEANPVLMRLRELEVLEKVAGSSNLQVVMGESGLVDRLTKLI